MGRRKSGQDSALTEEDLAAASNPKLAAFLEACREGDMRGVQRVLKNRKFEIDSDVRGVTGLMLAAAEGHLEVVKHLVDKGAGQWCEGPAEDPHTPFCHAARKGRLNVVRYFVEDIGIGEDGMNKYQGKSKRKTALDYALSRGEGDTDQTPGMMEKYQVCAYLKDKKAQFGEGVTDPAVVFGAATRGDAYYVLYCCIANGSMANARHNKNRETLLHHACRLKKLKVVQVLLTGGVRAQINARDELGQTPLMLASCTDNDDIVATLLHMGADVNLSDNAGRTALHYACVNGRLPAVKGILAKVDCSTSAITQMDNMKWTPLMAAFGILDFSPSTLGREQPAPLQAPTPDEDADVDLHVHVIQYLQGVLDGSIEAADAELVTSSGLSEDKSFIRLRELSPGLAVTSQSSSADEKTALSEAGATARPKKRSSVGRLRLNRFLESTNGVVWGFDEKWGMFMSREDFENCEDGLPDFFAAKEQGLLVPMADIPAEDDALFLSHSNVEDGLRKPDSYTLKQAFSFLHSPEGASIKWIWSTFSCMNIEDVEVDVQNRNHVELSVTKNVITVIARCSHFLAIPATKLQVAQEKKSSDEAEGGEAPPAAPVAASEEVKEPAPPSETPVKQAVQRRRSSAEVVAMQKDALPGGELTKTKKKECRRSSGGGDSQHSRRGSQQEGLPAEEDAVSGVVLLESSKPPPRVPPPDGRYSDLVGYLEDAWTQFGSACASVLGTRQFLCLRWGPAESQAVVKEIFFVPVVDPGMPGVLQGTGYRGAAASAVADAVRAGHVAPTFWQKVKVAFSLTPATEPKMDPTAAATSDLANTLATVSEPTELLVHFLKAVFALYVEQLELEVLSDDTTSLFLLERISLSAVSDVQKCFLFSADLPRGGGAGRAILVNIHLLLMAYATGTLQLSADGKEKRPLPIRYQDALERGQELESEVEKLQGELASEREATSIVQEELNGTRRELQELQRMQAEHQKCSCTVS